MDSIVKLSFVTRSSSNFHKLHAAQLLKHLGLRWLDKSKYMAILKAPLSRCTKNVQSFAL